MCPDEKPEKYVSIELFLFSRLNEHYDYNSFIFRREAIIKKTSVRPFSQYANENKYRNAHTDKENFGFAENNGNVTADNKTLSNGAPNAALWYRDVVELRKKAESYKVIVCP